MASTTTASPISVHSTPLLPSQVTALTTLTTAAWPATRLFSHAAALGSADSRGPHRRRTSTSRSAKTNAATVTTASGASVRLAAVDMAPLLPTIRRFTRLCWPPGGYAVVIRWLRGPDRGPLRPPGEPGLD